MELSILVHCSGKAAAKLKALKVQEENELQMARELMGSGPPGSIDGMIPSSKDDFEKLSKVGNIWFLSSLVLSKWEDLAFSVCIKVCLFFNFWMLKCTIMANKT